MTAIEVRPARESDAETMAAIYVTAARQAWGHIFGEPNLETLQPPVDRLRAEIAAADPRKHVLVADRERQVIAFAVVRPSQDEDADNSRVGELDPSTPIRPCGAKGSVESSSRRCSTRFARAASQRRPSGHRKTTIVLDGSTR